MTADLVIAELEELADPDKALILQRFFKTGKGEYAEGDLFKGIKVPDQRSIARKFAELPDDEVLKLLHSPWHEHRLTGLIIWVNQSQKAKYERKKALMNLYLANTKWINNWDLVDVTAPVMVGACVPSEDVRLLLDLADSPWLWDRRIAMIATLWHIRKKALNPAFILAQRLLEERHDLMQKAVGWMLREAGKKDPKRLREFLKPVCGQMPRTMLRYAIEHFPEEERQQYLKNRF